MPNTAAEVQFTVANSLSRAVTAAPTLVPQSAAEKHADDAKKIRVRSQVNPHRFQIHRGYLPIQLLIYYHIFYIPIESPGNRLL